MAPPLVDTATVNGAGMPLAIDTLGGTWHVAAEWRAAARKRHNTAIASPGVNCSTYCAV